MRYNDKIKKQDNTPYCDHLDQISMIQDEQIRNTTLLSKCTLMMMFSQLINQLQYIVTKQDEYITQDTIIV